MSATFLSKNIELEKFAESDATDFAEGHGWWTCKFTSPGLRGVPDRIYLRERIGIKRTVFVEWKKDGEPPSVQQLKRHREMRNAGAEVYVLDRSQFDEFKRIMK